MSRVLSQRRKIGGLTGTLHKLLGIEQKMRSTRSASSSCAASTTIGGRHAFDAVWESPENLPTRRGAERTRDAGSPGSTPHACESRCRARRPRAGRARRRRLQRRRRLARVARARVRARARRARGVRRSRAARRVPGTTPRRCARAAARFGARARVERVDVGLGPNLEARARDARYAALERVRAEVGADGDPRRRTRATTRPRRCCCRCCGARARPGSAGMAPRRGLRAPAAARDPAARHARALRAAAARRRCTIR